MTRQLRAAGRATGALVVLGVLLAGVPLLLTSTVGNPLDAWPDLRAGDISDIVVIDLLAAVAYLAWAQFALAFAVELIAQIRRVPAPRRVPGVFSGQQQLAHVLVAALLAMPVITGVAVPPSDQTVATTRTAGVISNRTAAPVAARRAATTLQPQHRVVTIQTEGPGTYWDLARVYLGAGERWHAIWDLNRGRRQGDGAVMSSPGLLRPGWQVLIPDTPGEGTDPDHGPVQSVVVETGDTLTGIAAAHADQHGWTDLWDRNRGRSEPHQRTFTDPDHIEPRWTIDVPMSPAPSAQVPSPQAPSPAEPQTSAASPTVRPTGDLTPSPSATSEPQLGSVSATTSTPSTTTTPSAVIPESTSEPAVTSDHSQDTPADGRGAQVWQPASLVGAGFGGGLLTGVTLMALLRHRRRQFRYRRPGRTIPATPTELLGMEKTLLGAGSAGIVDVTWLDQALRGLAHRLADTPGAELPDVIAVRIDHEALELVLAEAAPRAPAPWTVDQTGLRWTARRGDDLGYTDKQRAFHFAPYPALACVGYTTDGEQWLVDLERIGGARLSGDRDRCLNLARFVAAELAHNVWSEQVDVELVGFGAEMARLNPERLHHNPDPGSAVAAVRARRTTAVEVLDRAGVDVLSGRLRNIDADMWMPHVLVIADSLAAGPGSAGDHGPSRALDLLRDLATGPRRTAVAVLAITPPSPLPEADPTAAVGEAQRGSWEMTVDAAGTLRIPALALELIAQQVPEHEAAQLAQLLAAAARIDDRPMPPARGNRPWDAYADAAGAPLPAVTVQRSTLPSVSAPRDVAKAVPVLHLADPTTDRHPDDAPDAATASVLPEPTSGYVERTATTAEDIEALAPGVTNQVRRQIHDADPTLDVDLAAWHASDSPLPKLTLLGPVDVTAHGPLPQTRPRKAWNVEVVAYLACHPRGVSAEQFGTDLWPGDPDIAGKSKLRQAIYIARKWLGTNPRTGRDHLPPATPSPGGPALYRVEDILVDAELFRRLRLRGVARGPEGIPDLQAALDLITGIPFDQRRPGGYGWLAETPLDHEYTAMIVDVAHLVATHHLAAGHPTLARAAAQTALAAGSSDDIALLDLVAVCDAEGHQAEADRYIQRILANHDAEVEEDLPPRTAMVLHRRSMGYAS